LFNLLITCGSESWDSNLYEFDKNRVAIEYTVDEISERYKSLNDNAIKELKSLPTLFVIENESTASRIGYITDIKLRLKTVKIEFEINKNIPELPIGSIESLRTEFGLGKWELSRTHWAIKDENLFNILLRKNYITEEHLSILEKDKNILIQPNNEIIDTSKVFIVYGHDEIAKMDISTFICDLGLEPIILHQQASSGRTIIEKIDAYTNVGFAIVLYTPCDIGAKKGNLTSSYRARQNVVFEHGHLIAKLGREKVTALVKGKIEIPNDISGIVYIALDENERWKEDIKVEMRSIGYQV